MPLWLWVFIFVALIKLPIAGAMLWLPMRHDSALVEPEVDSSSEDEGGSHALPGSPVDPHPRTPFPRHPRRGPHGSPAPDAPARVRTVVRKTARPAHPVR